MTGLLTQITRHPIKGHGRETRGFVALSAGECMAWDRRRAVAHDAVGDGWGLT